jgi:hypothetical protein
MADSTPPMGGSQAPASSPKMGKGSLVRWKYVGNYVLLGCAVFMTADLVWEGIEIGKWKWYRFGLPLLFIAMVIANFANIKRAEKEAASDPARDSGSGNP